MPPTDDPFAILKATNEQGTVAGDFFHVEKMQSFALGCAKALAKNKTNTALYSLNYTMRMND